MKFGDTFNCSICKKEIDDEWGNNPYPVTQEGECCDKCNDSVVIPARLKQLGVG
jgi:hypothetical protein